MRYHLSGLLFVFGLLMIGCTRSPERQVYTLRDASTTRSSTISQPRETLAIMSLTIPEAVDRNKMVTRQTGSARLEISDIHRWAEPLTAEIAIVLADDITLERPGTLVTTPGQVSTAQHPDHQIDIDITRFEGSLGIGIEIEAIWTLRNAQPNTDRHGQARIKEAANGGDHEALARAYSTALKRLAHLILSSIDSK